MAFITRDDDEPLLIGTGGDDTLIPGPGQVEMEGGAGNDLYIVTEEGQTVVEFSPTGGNDTIRTSVSVILGEATAGSGNWIENIVAEPDADGLLLAGNNLNNTIVGSNGEDFIDGGSGNDRMEGLGGDDFYLVDSATDLIVEQADGGRDRVESTVSYVLPVNVEDIELHPGFGPVPLNINATGNALDNAILGNDGNNVLSGLAGNDELQGAGGNDNLQGGDGNDELGGGDGNDLLDGGNGNDGLGGGDGNDTLLGQAGNDFLSGGAGRDTLNGGLGDDTFFLVQGEDESDVLVEAANAGNDTVVTEFDHTLALNVENLILVEDAVRGRGNALANTLIGNGLSNTLEGFVGDDILDGRGGADRMLGGAGNDTYVVDNFGDVVVERAGEGIDTVRATTGFYLLPNNVENLVFAAGAGGGLGVLGRGNNLANSMVGSADDDNLSAYGGDDTLDGGQGADVMFGGGGNDTYIMDDVEDLAVENGGAGSGTDTILFRTGFVPQEWQLTPFVERGVLLGTGNDSLIGNAGNNTLTGNGGDNYLDGGDGNDTLVGGLGNDTYLMRTGDTVVEAANGGIDTVLSRVAGTLNMGVGGLLQVENATLVDGLFSGTAATNIIGNTLANVLHGNELVNTLDGKAGNDSLFGHAGNDILVGDLGDDYLDGGRGQDLMIGGAGNDTYVVNRGDGKGGVITDPALAANPVATDTASSNFTEDAVVELANGGTDTVLSFVHTYSLPDNVENLILAGEGAESASPALAIVGIGNGLNNLIVGNRFANLLIGDAGNDTLVGGQGADFMVGGIGNDVFEVDDSGDVVVEDAAGGVDLVRLVMNPAISAGSEFGDYTLADNVENLLVVRSGGDGRGLFVGGNALNNLITGSDGDEFLFGDAGNDTLIGGAGNDALDGGVGTDRMDGGAGDDFYMIDTTTDVVVETPNNGFDTVASVNVNVLLNTAPLANVEQAELMDFDVLSGLNLNAVGNAQNNILIGNSGSNTLDGQAGNDLLIGDGDSAALGADRMLGGAGNDFFVVNLGDGAGSAVAAGDEDTVVELANGGNDTVLVAFDAGGLTGAYVLPDQVEYAIAFEGGSGNPVAVTGNALNNVIVGVVDSATQAYDGGAGDDVFLLNRFGDGDSLNGGGNGTAGDVAFVTLNGTDSVWNTSIQGIESLFIESTGLGTELHGLATPGAGAPMLVGITGNAYLDLQDLGSNAVFGAVGFSGEALGFQFTDGAATLNLAVAGADFALFTNAASVNFESRSNGFGGLFPDTPGAALIQGWVNAVGSLAPQAGFYEPESVAGAVQDAQDLVDLIPYLGALGPGERNVVDVSNVATAHSFSLTGGGGFALAGLDADDTLVAADYTSAHLVLDARTAGGNLNLTLGGNVFTTRLDIGAEDGTASAGTLRISGAGGTSRLDFNSVELTDGVVLDGVAVRVLLNGLDHDLDASGYDGILVGSYSGGGHDIHLGGLVSGRLRTAEGADNIGAEWTEVVGRTIQDSVAGDGDTFTLNVDAAGPTSNSHVISNIETLNYNLQASSGTFALDASEITLDSGVLQINVTTAGQAFRLDHVTGPVSVAVSGNSSDILIGSNEADTLSGGGGNDRLNGRAGADIYTGGAGDDRFDFFNTDGATKTITDFGDGGDKLWFSVTAFGQDIIAGGLPESGSTAINAGVFALAGNETQDTRFIYDYDGIAGQGHLYYDADGTGSLYDAQEVALVQGTGAAGLSAADLVGMA